MPLNTLFSYRSQVEGRELLDSSHPAWRSGQKAVIDTYWNGESAVKVRGMGWNNLTEVSSLWDAQGIYFHFRCWYDELFLNPKWSTEESVYGLWERDVVEVFIQPESSEGYFEIEVSPLGQWLDVHVRQPRVDMDFAWSSGMEAAAELEEERRVWTAVLKLPWEPMREAGQADRKPEVGDAWRLNLYRMAGREPDREFLAWRPTFTQYPDFHVPSSFGNLIFFPEKKQAEEKATA